MSDSRIWIIIDDQPREAESFAASFERSRLATNFAWKPMLASDGRQALLTGTDDTIAGVFIDVDLSNDGKIVGTGLGLAQDIRAEQKKKRIADYPVFRFANPDPVREYIGDDPASDDLFDLLISKETARTNPTKIAQEAFAARSIYDQLITDAPKDLSDFSKFCGLSIDHFEIWADTRLWQKVRLGLGETSSIHVAAGNFLRSFLMPEGLLITDDVLAVRLGIDPGKSAGWGAIADVLQEARYTGLGSEGFSRWWARGVDAFWLTLDDEEYLHQRSSEERVARLKAKTGLELTPLQPAAPYWRLCALSLRRNELRPIEPSRSLTLIQRGSSEPWIDPEQASPDVAAMHRTDPRVDPEELARLIA